MGLWNDSVRELTSAGLLTVWGEPVVYIPASTGTPVSIQGVFDSVPATVTSSTGAEMQVSQPTLDVRISDLPAQPRRDDGLTVRGQSWRVSAVAPDGQGWASLTLQVVA